MCAEFLLVRARALGGEKFCALGRVQGAGVLRVRVNGLIAKLDDTHVA